MKTETHRPESISPDPLLKEVLGGFAGGSLKLPKLGEMNTLMQSLKISERDYLLAYAIMSAEILAEFRKHAMPEGKYDTATARLQKVVVLALKDDNPMRNALLRRNLNAFDSECGLPIGTGLDIVKGLISRLADTGLDSLTETVGRMSTRRAAPKAEPAVHSRRKASELIKLSPDEACKVKHYILRTIGVDTPPAPDKEVARLMTGLSPAQIRSLGSWIIIPAWQGVSRRCRCNEEEAKTVSPLITTLARKIAFEGFTEDQVISELTPIAKAPKFSFTNLRKSLSYLLEKLGIPEPTPS